MKGYLYVRLISQHVYINLYQRLRKIHFFCDHWYYRNPLVSLLIRRLQPRLFTLRSLNLTACQRPKYSPWLMLSGVSCHFWNNQGIKEDEIWESVSDFDKLFPSFNHPAKDSHSSTPHKTKIEIPCPFNNRSKLDESGEDHGSSDEDEDSHNELNNANNITSDSDETKKLLTGKGWEPIILRDNFQVWRREINSNGTYQYKVFGTFTDVPAIAFFTVQRDLDYRKSWDKLVIKLEVVDKQNEFKKARKGDQIIDSGNEVIHWVMHYPFPMYSRDYCYVRRSIIDFKNNIIVLVSRSVDHPKCPVSDKYVRVNEYESQMVIKPHTTFDANGFDYVLTYFDDPRSAFPNPAYNWMAASGVPNFVESLHKAALQLNRRDKKSSNNSLDNNNHHKNGNSIEING
ncbi:stAR-related lipid transfer protein 7, mitochondrial isoform X2 [Tetranychus urticae]|uniref:stAR-related lipid transfer protein 7, mitochondrial isoform X2 n=1 Tax=Tetranychus urticae TaxID=32264 RepID=UPI00077BD72D|nr:stAR-related lipid transfer protein 7, mitochondrial isoform X2 [Tetranychus urticae]